MSVPKDTAFTLTKWQAWLLATRPRTLPASAAPVIVAGAAAFYDQVFRLDITLFALAASILLQIGANFANDVFDYHKGADNEHRLGPLRVTQAGLLTPREMYAGMFVVFGLATLAGIYLISQAGLPILLIGIFAILAAIAYTGGPLPYGYLGLGDLFVFIFFGPAAVCGTYYAQAGVVSSLAVWVSIPMGLLITAILAVNNLRDLETDARAGKITLAVRYGALFVQVEYIFCLLIAFTIPALLVFGTGFSPWIFTVYISLIWVPQLIKAIFTSKGKRLNLILAGTGQLVLYYAIFLSVGLVIAAMIAH
jgi:1,4-dihydroxy-2-naphthoate polyprenyltransferase